MTEDVAWNGKSLIRQPREANFMSDERLFGERRRMIARNCLAILVALLLVTPSGSQAQDVALLLFDGETGQNFAGCLNCSRSDSASVCSRYGDYGSRYSDTSIWSRYGSYGGRYETNSPWSRYGEGLRVVDSEGNYYGRFSRSRVGQSKLPIVQALLEAWEYFDEDRIAIRDWFCDF